MKKRNSKGQFTKEMSILIPKELQAVADEIGVRIKPIIRDELERTFISNIYGSREPTGDGNYHHRGLIASNVKGLIDGNAVKAVVENVPLPDVHRSESAAKTTADLYEILVHGSKATAKNDVYVYTDKDGKPAFSSYKRQPKHDFEQNTLDDMEVFLDELASDLRNRPERYLSKYRNKRI